MAYTKVPGQVRRAIRQISSYAQIGVLHQSNALKRGLQHAWRVREFVLVRFGAVDARSH